MTTIYSCPVCHKIVDYNGIRGKKNREIKYCSQECIDKKRQQKLDWAKQRAEKQKTAVR